MLKRYITKDAWVYDRAYAPGETVKLESTFADELNKQFPGCLQEIEPEKKKDAEKPE